ncbi:filamentous hemagglutinin N-terminal domain-containing protein [Pseudomonas lijiangensis]|uniref:two-partner secretion domain-containing protein n=1 Tax=Pseudomonas lijiangensis TaxID=2995658 RepID=UPI0034D3A66F
MDVRQLAFLARQPSAALKEREHFWGLPKRGIALILANAMFWQPMWAQADGIVVSGSGTGLAQAGNGVPIVNIATPNATGLSHNQFQQYNVDAQGLILNNIAQQTGATQLGGIIVGNPNLNNGVAAQVILNEVVGANASQLKGYTEVAGQAARVIVANPYGITCNGCGFLNTPQVTLTTGKPVLDSNGGLVRFTVQNGSVAIEGLGLNADNVDQFDIITRSAKINAELHAKKLNIIAGRNDVDAQTLSATALADDGSAKPELAIDSSALGGMYVGAVKLVGTEAGVGVRLASNVAASAGDIQIDANGKLTLTQAVASGAVAVNANAVEVKGPLYAGTSLSVTTPGDLSIQQNVAARDVVTLSSTGQLTNTAIIEAGINADNSRNTSGDVVLSAGNLTNTGSVVASRALQATASQTLNNQGGTLSGQASTRITATTLDNRQSGRILSQGGSVEVTASGVSNGQKGLISSAGTLTINAASLDNQQGVVRSTGASTLTVTDAMVNQGGEVLSDAGLTLTSGRLDNSRSGRIAGKGVTVTTGAFDNHLDGRLTSTEALRLTAAQVNNSEAGRIASAMALTVVVTGLDLSTAILNNDQGVVRSESTLTLNAGAVSNTAGSLTSAGTANLTVTGAVANQGGEVLSDTGLTLTSGRLDNSRSGRIAGKGVTVTTGAFDNHLDGRLTSTEALRLTAAQVNNSEAGRIASAMALTAVVTGLDQHADGRLYSKGDVSLDLGNGHLNNQDGLITAPGQLLLTRLGTVNNQSGEISSAKGFTLAATSLDNTDGTVLSDEALIVRVDKALTNLRGLVSGKGVDLTAATLNNDSGEVSSEAGLTLDVTGEVSNRQGLLSSAAATTLEAKSLDNAEGQVMADEELTVILAQALDNQAGTLGAGLGLDLRAASLDNRLAGAVLTDGQLDITLTGTLDNRTGGQVQAKGMLTLTSQVLNNQGGRVVGQDLLTVHSDSALNRGGVIRADQLMKLFIGDLDNSQTGLTAAQKGAITSQAGLTFIGTQLDNQNGLLNAVGVMTLQADTLLNGTGRIASQSDLTAIVDTVTQQGGELVAQGTLTLTGQRLDNQAGGLVGATKALKLTVDDIDNRAGEVSSQVGVELIGDRLDNRDGGKVLAGTALQLLVERVINENKGLLFGQTLTLDGQRLDNAGGTLASQLAQTLTLTGALNNRAGLLSSEAALTVKAASLDNTGGTLSSAGALKVTTDGALINQGGSITTDAALTVVSGSLDNSQKGKLSGQGATKVTTGAFDNRQGGQLTSRDTLELIAGQVINQSAGRIASALALTASVTSLDQQGGELFSNTTLSLDLNNGQLNNQGGLINSPGALLLKNLKAVDNQGGEISSAQAFTLKAQSLDNSGGKLLGSQALTLDLVEFFRNLKGTVSATGLNIDSDSLTNDEGLISSRAGMTLTVDQALSNVKGSVIADGDLDVSAATGNNAQGEISSQKALTAVIGNLQQQGGQLFALGSLSLTGDTLNNRLKGFVGAGEALTLTVEDIDNQGGEISSQKGITLTGQTLTNSGGQVLAQQALTLAIAKATTNRNDGVLSGKTGLTLTGASLDNTGGVISGLQGLGLDLSGALDNSQGLISSEGTLSLEAGSLTNTAGSVSSAGTLTLDIAGALANQGGELVTDDALTLTSSSLDNSLQGTVSAKGRVTIDTGDLDNSQKGRISSGERLDLTAARLTNHGGSIASQQALVASVSSLEQQKGSLTSATALSLDVNQGLLDNQGGLINAPGTLLLKNLKTVLNQGGEISSAQAFTLNAQSLDNSGGTLLSNQLLTLRIAQALNNVKGMIAAAGVDATAASLDNTGGTLTSRNALDLTVTGLLNNRDKGLINAAETLKITSGDLNNRGGQLLGTTALTLDSAALDTGAKGLINSQGTLNITADSLSADTGGEVSALGTMTLVLNALSLDASRLIGNAGLSLDLNGADLNNRAGLITAKGPLTFKQVRDVNNQGGEISSAQAFTLTARTLDNSGGQLISSDLLTLNADSLLNQNGLISGWQGLDVTATSLDNRNRGTLSSRNGAVDVDLSGALLNSGAGALVSQTALTVTADSLDNRGGILSSGTAQTLTVTGLLNNSQSGLIDSGADLTLTANALDNSAGTLISTGKATLDLIGALTNTGGKLASGGDWLLKRSSALHNQGGQLISQRLMTLNTGLLDNSTTGTVAANGTLLITATGKVLNHTDGLIYSQNAGVELDATSLDNTRGAVQGQSTLKVETSEGIDNLNGRLIAQNGDLTVEAARLDNRGGLLSSLKGLFTAQISGVLKNGYDLAANRQGGVIQAQRLSLTALGGFDNYGGRVSASTGEALLTTANLDNRNGGIYAKGLVRVIAKDLDNSGDNDGQIAGGQVDLRLTGDLNNRLGIIESDSTLAIKAASLDNQTGQIRSLGTLDAADFQIGTLFDNRRGTVEVANSNLILNAASFLNASGNLIHAGAGTFDISTANLTQAGGNLVTRGGLTVTADSWTNSSVIQAGRLTVNVGTFNQTASGQLLASSAFVGTGGSWTNEGVIASDGTLSLNLTGGYGGGGRTSSVGIMGINAAQIDLNASTAITAGTGGTITSSGSITNLGRLTAIDYLTVNAASINNQGTLGAGGNLRINSDSLSNLNGLIFSGGNMALRTNTFTNRFADVYSLGDLSIAKDDNNGWSSSINNISATIESVGDMSLAADYIENRKDVFEATGGWLYSAIGLQCYSCTTFEVRNNFEIDAYLVWVENYQSKVVKDSAAANLVAGHDFLSTGGKMVNSQSTISAGNDVKLEVQSFTSQGASVGDYSVRKTLAAPRDLRSWFAIMDYNSINDALYDSGSLGYLNGHGPFSSPYLHVWNSDGVESRVLIRGGSTGREDRYIAFGSIWVSFGGGEYGFPLHTYNVGVRTEAPDFVRGAAFSSNTIVYANSSSSANAVVQAGGTVRINASQELTNSVVREGVTLGVGTSKMGLTQLSGQAKPTVVQINAQLPPDLSQQQVNPLTLPGFSLPTGQNGLFRLSAQTGSNVAATQTSTTPQNWTLGSASVSVAQREQTVSDTQARALQFGTAGQVSTATRQLADVVRQNSGLSANASAFDSSAPVDSATRLQLTGHSAGSTGLTPVADVTQVQSQNGTVSLPGQGATTVPVITPVASSTTTAQNGTTTSTAVPSTQVARVQALPGNTAPPNPHKYLIETNPVLTDLRQFMSSDYLLAGLGYDPEASAKRLGDGLYEQRLVQQAIVARTGQAFLAGQTSNEAQLKYLMNNAIASKEQLNLAIGVTLTPPQVAALTHDIVWLEEHEVNGEKVLVPVLYLAQANNRLGPTGALIAGNDVTLTAGQELDNVGTLRATNNLSATAGTNLVNTGLIEAGNRLDLLAGNDLINKAGGILYGRDVTLSATRGDVINERTVTRAVSVAGYQDFADSAARVESANDLTIKAGRDVMSIGGTLQAGRDLSLIAGRDVNIGAAQTETAKAQGANTQSSITQLGSSVSVGRDLMALSGRDINVVASDIDAKRDIAMAATENMTISSAADETHSLSRSKKLTVQTDHVKQVSADLNAGGSIVLNAGQDLAVISSRITAGENANLSAGENLSILAAQDSDYYLYDKKSKGSWGKKKTKRDEVTDIRNVGSEITSGGDLTLESGGDQLYQVARLTSGNDLTIESGGGVTFEGVKDLHQESHTKSKSSAAWFSSKGKGRTDETLRQSELTAQGDIVINAVGKIRADVRQVNQQTVSESIDAMVKADPKLAWLKELEAQGGVDWHQVQEIHTQFKYANSGLGPAAQMVIAILMTVMLGPAGAGLGGWALAGASSLATTGTVATINNKGDLGAGLKAMVSKDGLTNAAIAAITAGVAENYLGDMTMTKQVNGKVVIDLGSVEAVSHFAGQQLINNTSAAAIAKAFGRDVSLSGILQSTVYSTLAAYSFDQVGNLGLTTGSPEKVALHAIVGGMIAEASGSDFAVGAMAAGVNEAFANQLRRMSAQIAPEQRDQLMLLSSQLLGVVAAAAVAGDDAGSLQTGSWVASNATLYNNLNHSDMSDFVGDMKSCGSDEECQRKTWVGGKYQQASDWVNDWSKNAVSGVVASSMLNQIQGGLVALKELNCTTATCLQYKDLLTERAVTDLTELAKVTGMWEHATSIAALALPVSGGVRGPNAADAVVSARTQAAIERFWGAKGLVSAEKTALPAGYREGGSVGAAFNETALLPEGYRRVINTKTGNTEVLATDGTFYFETSNGLKPKAGGNLASLVEAEKNIASAKGSLPEIKMVDGFYQAEGAPFKFSEYYYNRLWSTGRGAPFVQADEVLKTATTVTPDRMAGFYRYTNGSMEMVYNPVTKEVWHLQPLR